MDALDPTAFDENLVQVEKMQPQSKPPPPHTAAPLDLSFKTFVCANGKFMFSLLSFQIVKSYAQ